MFVTDWNFSSFTVALSLTFSQFFRVILEKDEVETFPCTEMWERKQVRNDKLVIKKHCQWGSDAADVKIFHFRKREV